MLDHVHGMIILWLVYGVLRHFQQYFGYIVTKLFYLFCEKQTSLICTSWSKQSILHICVLLFLFGNGALNAY